MVERGNGFATPKEAKKSGFLLRRVVPHPITVHVVDKLLGEGLDKEGHKKLKVLIRKVLCGEKIKVSQEVPPVYENYPYSFEFEDEDNIPKKGSTLFIGNHTRGGPMYDMGQYFETAKVVSERREHEPDEDLREPRIIAQRGLTKVIKLPGGSRLMWSIPFTGQFYDLAAKSLNYITVSPPKFNKGDQITNKQYLPKETVDYLLTGGAILWFPQGKHKDPDNLAMPEKSVGLLSKLKNEDLQVVAMRFIPSVGRQRIIFSEAVHIQEIPLKEENVDVDAFVAKYLQPLGSK